MHLLQANIVYFKIVQIFIFYFRKQHALKQCPGAGKENITVLAVSNAAGRALEPLIIFRGKHMLSTWFGDKVLPLWKI